MKYKVGDKVRVRKELIPETDFGGVYFGINMREYKGKEAIVKKVGAIAYHLDIDGEIYWWTDEMLEPVEEMSAKEAVKLSGKLCSSSICDECPVFKARKKYSEGCNVFKNEHTEEHLEILKQWKADHEKKPIETEFVWYVQITEADTHLLKHEELLKTDFSISMDRKKEEILKKYCSEHDGKYYAIAEKRCVVKE